MSNQEEQFNQKADSYEEKKADEAGDLEKVSEELENLPSAIKRVITSSL